MGIVGLWALCGNGGLEPRERWGTRLRRKGVVVEGREGDVCSYVMSWMEKRLRLRLWVWVRGERGKEGRGGRDCGCCGDFRKSGWVGLRMLAFEDG